MRIAFSVPNNAYILLFGDQMIDLDGTFFFQTKDEIKEALARRSLKILRNKRVVTEQ